MRHAPHNPARAGERKVSAMYALKRWTRSLALVFCGAMLMAALIGFHADASPAKGSSCANPYRIKWAVPTGTDTGIEGVSPGEMYGDIHAIKAQAGFNGQGFSASWAPKIGGLKVCRVRITFDHLATFYSHEWHRSRVEIPTEYGTHVRSFTVEAAR